MFTAGPIKLCEMIALALGSIQDASIGATTICLKAGTPEVRTCISSTRADLVRSANDSWVQ